MNNSFSISDHQPRCNEDFSELEIVEISSNNVVQTYDLSSPTMIKVESGNYVVSQDSCPDCYAQSFDSSEGETVEFTGGRMAGVTIIRIEGTLRPHKEYTFELDRCPVYLHYQAGKLKALASANAEGSGFDPYCVSIQDLVTA